MKVESENVLELIKIVKAYVSGISEIVQIGDDGFKESVNDQKNALFNEMANWQALHIVKKEPQTKDLNEHRLQDLNPAQRWENQLYSFLLRKLKVDDKIAEISSEKDLFYHIEQYLETTGGEYLKQFYYNYYVMAGIKVVQSVVDKVLDERKKNPQQKLL